MAQALRSFITVWGGVQIVLQIIGWFRLGAKSWPGTVGGLLTALPNAGKCLMSPLAQELTDGVPLPALIEAAIDIDGNLIGGIFYILNAVIST